MAMKKRLGGFAAVVLLAVLFPSGLQGFAVLAAPVPPIIRKVPDLKPVSPEKPLIPGKIDLKPLPAARLQIKPETVGALKANPAGAWNPPYSRSGTVFVLVSEKISYLDQVMPEIRRYAEDVAFDGYKVFLYRVSFEGSIDPFFSHVRDLKSFIRGKWLGVLEEAERGGLSREAFEMGTGVVLIGTFPAPLVHKRMATTREDPDVPGKWIRTVYEGVTPCDLFLTDMDGSWNILDPNGIPLVTTIDSPSVPQDSECVPGDEIDDYWQPQPEWGKSGARPEIWIGRIDPRPVVFSGNDVRDSLKRYFEGNHNYRAGLKVAGQDKVKELTFENRLLYYDDDMEEHASAAASMIELPWSSAGSTKIVSSPAKTRKADFLDTLKDGNFLWVEAFMHSTPAPHEFAYPECTEKKIETLPRTELFQGFNGRPLRALFYYHHGCSVCRYTELDNLGESYLFNKLAVPSELNPLAVLGNTSVGPHDTAFLYAGLMYGLNLGQAQMLSQRAYARSSNWATTFPAYPGRIDPKRYYNQTLLGDPTLRPRPFSPTLKPAPPDLPRIYDLVKSRYGSLFRVNLARLKALGLSASSAATRKAAQLVPAKPFPVDRQGAIIDPGWGAMGIPALQRKLRLE